MAMKFRMLIVLLVSTLLSAQIADRSGGPDPKEIPIPAIKAPIAVMPGVNALPVRNELPDVMVMNDGTKVTTRGQWERRREELKRLRKARQHMTSRV